MVYDPTADCSGQGFEDFGATPEAALVLAKAVDGPWAFYASGPPTSFRAASVQIWPSSACGSVPGPAQTLGSYSPWSAIDLSGFVAPFHAVLTP